ncbi:MAG: hypothetical protein AAF984_01320 [Verrucomicrobiota bacterium]
MEEPKYSAKEILHAYRSDGQDAEDAFFQDALAATQKDSDLNHWFTTQQTFDKKMTAAIQSEVPPEDLKDKLLAIDLEAHEKVVPSQNQSHESTHRFSSRRSKTNSALLALAACFVLLLGVNGLVFFSTFSSATTGDVIAQKVLEMNETGKINLGKTTHDPSQLHTWLANHNSPHNFVIPAGLSKLTGLGCQTYKFNGTQVSLVCFKLSENQTVHMFVVDQDALQDPPGSQPVFNNKGNSHVASWTSGKHSYFITGVDQATLKRLI